MDRRTKYQNEREKDEGRELVELTVERGITNEMKREQEHM
jgi:hypothetical protein